MRKGVLLLLVSCLGWLSAVAQNNEGARIAARSNVESYEEEAGVRKCAYRESPYFMEFTGRWDQKRTDSSIVYSRDVEVEKFWKEYCVSLNVRCGRACRVLLNGKEVGYGDDSRHWNEFSLDNFLKYGKKNRLIIETLKHPQSALLESGEQMEGLNGEPYLLFKGNPNVSDVALQADYEALTETGSLSIDVSVFNGKKKGKYYVEVEIWDPRGRTFDRMGRWVVFDKTANVLHVDISREWGRVEPWSAETPNLYTAVVRLRNEKMEEEELVGARFGFRRVEVKDGLLLMNGKPLTLKGVTYGLNHTEGLTGRERIRQDLLTMKQNNINAVRTSRFSPMDPYFYQLCDEMGFYVICDANLLPSSTQQHAVATDKDFIPLFERRVENMYGKYKNHSSIVAWSLGDSPDNGICMAAAYKRLKQLDPSRPVIFAGAEHTENTDVIALMNPSVLMVRQSMEKSGDRPYIMLVSVDSDNFSTLEELWQQVESHRNLQGGFVNQWPLGGPRLYALKGLYSPFDVHLSKTTIDDAEFTVYNRNDFLNFSNYILEYTIFTNLRTSITAGDLPVAIEGGGVEAVKLRMPPVELQSGEEIFIRFDLQNRKPSAGERQLGTVVFSLPYENSALRPFVNKGHLVIDTGDVDKTSGLWISRFGQSLPLSVFKIATAQIKNYFCGSYNLFNNSPTLKFDGHRNWDSEVVAVTYRTPDTATVCIDAMVQYKQTGRAMCDVRMTYTYFGSGDVVVDYTLSPTDAFKGELHPMLDIELPRWEDDTLMWFGLDRENCFSHSNTGIPGTYRLSRAKLDGSVRQKVRWCAHQKEDNSLYIFMPGTLFTMGIHENILTVTPTEKSKTFRLLLSVNDSYGMDIPVVKTGIVEPPKITSTEPRFTQPLTVKISAASEGSIRYTLDGSEPTVSSPVYTAPLTLSSTTVVKARVFGTDGTPSFTATRKFNYDYIVRTTFSQKPNTPFNVGADTLLFDGERSSVVDLQHGWVGFSGNGVTTTVELSKAIDVEFVTLRYAHSPETWAFAPREVTVLLSSDGQTYTDTIHADIPFDPASVEFSEAQVVELRVPVGKKGVGFLKVDAKSIGVVPEWHRAKMLKPWLMMDEIEVGEITPANDTTPR